ncbi:MAG: PEGA domain-containing protein, partial [Candidatus Aminicenantes bacterium]|nr:PEGA domain-containing protein [Candidatus Aminicenantes bacterium]
DGTDTGQTTNCTLTNVNVGTYTVKLTLTNYEDWQQSVQVTAHQTTNVNATLIKKTGSIAITSNPTGARAYLDGTDTGQTTNCTLTNVNVGTHTLKLTLASYEDWQQSVDVRWNETTNVNATLTKKVGKLVITFSPNPSTRSGDGSWYSTMYAKETSGIGITLTDVTITGFGSIWSNITSLWGNPPHFSPNETKLVNWEFIGFDRGDSLTFVFYGRDDNGNSGSWSGSLSLQSPPGQDITSRGPRRVEIIKDGAVIRK